MKVYAVMGLREPELWTDPGAEEVVSLHATRYGAETALDGFDCHEAGYDYAEVREYEVKP